MEKDSEYQKLIHIHRGIIGTLSEGMDLPVGGSIFHDRLTTKLHLDFHNFEKISKESIDALYDTQKIPFEAWYMNMPEDLQNHLDAKTFFILMALQNGIKKRLHISDSPTSDDNKKKRNELYAQETVPNLSDFSNGQSFCAERAALGQYFLQEIGVPSLYMSGVSYYADIDDGADHSWIILFPNTERALIWDIARPHQNYPNIYRHEGGIHTHLFQGTDNCFIKTQKLLATSERYFGISDHPNMVHEGFSPQIVSQKISTLLTENFS